MATLERRDYPGYGQRFMRRFVRDCVVLALLFGSAMLASHWHYERTAKWLGLIWVVAMVAELVWSLRLVFRPKCPQCGTTLHGHADRIERTHLAPCPKCAVEWNLGIGHDSSS